MASGILKQLNAEIATFSVSPPLPHKPITRSPTAKSVTPSPTASTIPAISPPGANGRAGLNWYRSTIINVSGKLIEQAFTDTTTVPGAAVGSGNSPITSVSGPPVAVDSKAFISISSHLRAHATFYSDS
jgi:hypothetical protein